jgi:PAS domain S-box-containing protein
VKKAAMGSDSFEHEFLDALFERAPIGLAVLDKDLRYVRVNGVLAEINGRPAADHTGREVKEVLPELAPVVEPLLRTVLESRQPVLDLEVSGETPANGEVDRHFRVSFYPLVEADTAIGIGGLVIETTQQVRANRTLRQQAAIVYEDIVQALTVVQMSLEVGDTTKAHEAVMPALQAAREISSKILLSSADA